MKTWIVMLALLLNIHSDLFSAAPAPKKHKGDAEQPTTLGQILDERIWNAAVWKQKRSAIIKFVEQGEDPNRCIEGTSNGFTRCTPLITAACFHSDLAMVEMLTNADVNINSNDHLQMTPLHHTRSVAIAHHLLERGAEVHLQNGTNENPMHVLAKISTDTALLRMLARASQNDGHEALNAQSKTGDTPLHKLIVHAQFYREQNIIEYNTDVAAWYQTELIPKIAILLHEGARLNILNRNKKTPLQLLPPESGLMTQIVAWTPEQIKEIADKAVAQSPQMEQHLAEVAPLHQLLNHHLIQPLSSLVTDYWDLLAARIH